VDLKHREGEVEPVDVILIITLMLQLPRVSQDGQVIRLHALMGGIAVLAGEVAGEVAELMIVLLAIGMSMPGEGMVEWEEMGEKAEVRS